MNTFIRASVTPKAGMRVVVIAVLIALLVSTLAFVSVSRVNAQATICFGFSADLTNNTGSATTAEVSFIDGNTLATLAGPVTLTLNPGESGTLSLFAMVPNVPIFLGGGPGGMTINSLTAGPLPDSSCAGGPGRIDDGRINDGPNELGAPLAAYCTDDGGIEVWDIDMATGDGTLAFTSSADDISAGLEAAAAAGAPVQIGSGMGNSLWASPDNLLAVLGENHDRVTPGTYQFGFAGDYCGGE